METKHDYLNFKSKESSDINKDQIIEGSGNKYH